MHIRIASLYYRVKYLDQTQVVSANAPEASHTLGDFNCTVNHERLTAYPVGDHPDEDAARAALEPTLRAWEATSELLDGYPIRFDFEYSQQEVVDPTPGEAYAMAGVAMAGVTAEATLTIERGTFPSPSKDVQRVGDLTTLLRARWRNVLQGRELVTSGAYFVYTALENALGGPKGVADRLAVSANVLKTLSKLASTDDPSLGRKAGGHRGGLTADHIDWIKATSWELIRRVMRYEAKVDQINELTMDQLPPLKR
jgi:hypothetical protein